MDSRITVERWREVQAVFELAFDYPPPERAAFVREQCGNDPELQRLVEILLGSDETSVTLPEVPSLAILGKVLEEEVDARARGRKVGRYRVVRHLGSGGMGSVYLAERSDQQFEKRVAIKMLPFGLATAESIRRFRLERQILAELEHPLVARLLDGGTTEEGVPFLVMEYVEGESIVDYCDRRQLPIEDRLRLIVQVCSAVDYAHRNLIIHRDLKASNVLVTEDGVVKLLDFGIAKMLEDGVEAGATTTRDQRLTPEYASPEQISGRRVSTSTDVYSLGVLLYELLVGRRPLRLRSSSAAENERIVCEKVPLPPSDCVHRLGTERQAVARARRLRPGQLSRRLSGDLDNIVSKSLAKEPRSRYASAAELAEDLRRHLDGYPVVARPATLGYRLGRFVRRNSFLVAGGLAFVALAATFLVVTLLQAERIRRERDQARLESRRAEQVSQFLIESFEEAEPGRGRGELVTAREILDQGARKISRELRGAPDVRAAVQYTIGRVYSSLGLYPQADDLLDAAFESREVSGEETALSKAEILYEKTRVAIRRGAYQEAGELAERTLTAAREAGPIELELRARFLIGRLHEARGERREGIEVLRQALRDTQDLLAQESELVVEGMLHLGSVLKASGVWREAAEVLEDALELQSRYRPGDAVETAALLRNLAIVRDETGDRDLGAELGARALEMNRRLYGDRHRRVAEALNTLASIVYATDRPAAATMYQESLAVFRELLGPEHPRIASMLYNLGAVASAAGDGVGAEIHLREAVEIYRRSLAEVAPTHPNLAIFLLGHGNALNDLGRGAEAEVPLREALEIWRRRGEGDTPYAGRAMSLLAAALIQQERWAEAETLLESAYAIFVANPGKGQADLRRLLQRQITVFERTDRPQQAAQRYAELTELKDDRP